MKNVLGWLILLGVVAIGGILILNRPPVPPTSQLAQIPAGTRCANRPASYTTTVTDYAFSDSVPATTQGSIGGGWGISWNAAGRTSIVTDATAPVSPSNVLQWKYDAGGSSGSGVGDVSHSLPNVNQVYWCVFIKHSSNFEWNSISNKLLYLEPGNLLLESRLFQNYLPIWRSNGYGGTTTPLPLNTWTQVEWLVDSVNKRSMVWRDGVLETDLSMPVLAGGYGEAKIASTWGGSTGPRTRDSYRWIDHVLIAIPGSGTVTPPPPPPPPPPPIGSLPAIPGSPQFSISSQGDSLGNVNVAWGASSGATSYRYTSGLGAGSNWNGQSGTVSSNSVTLGSVPNGSSIWLCVWGKNSAGESADSACNSYTVPVATTTPPVPPTPTP